MLMNKKKIVDKLSRYNHPTFKILKWGEYSPDSKLLIDERRRETLQNSDVIISRIDDPGQFMGEHRNFHTIMLDLDVPARLVPSSTPGHSHLYIDVAVEWMDYLMLLRQLEEMDIIEYGVYRASKDKGFTSLRLPWVKKKDRELHVSPKLRRRAWRFGDWQMVIPRISRRPKRGANDD